MDILRNNDLPAAHKKRVMRSHFSLDNVKEFLRANDLSKVKEIHLLHLSDGNSDEARFKREIQELTGKPVFIH
jgi:phosphoribosyl 1,2-cyclic phosphodiesterase